MEEIKTKIKNDIEKIGFSYVVFSYTGENPFFREVVFIFSCIAVIILYYFSNNLQTFFIWLFIFWFFYRLLKMTSLFQNITFGNRTVIFTKSSTITQNFLLKKSNKKIQSLGFLQNMKWILLGYGVLLLLFGIIVGAIFLVGDYSASHNTEGHVGIFIILVLALLAIFIISLTIGTLYMPYKKIVDTIFIKVLNTNGTLYNFYTQKIENNIENTSIQKSFEKTSSTKRNIFLFILYFIFSPIVLALFIPYFFGRHLFSFINKDHIDFFYEIQQIYNKIETMLKTVNPNSSELEKITATTNIAKNIQILKTKIDTRFLKKFPDIRKNIYTYIENIHNCFLDFFSSFYQQEIKRLNSEIRKLDEIILQTQIKRHKSSLTIQKTRIISTQENYTQLLLNVKELEKKSNNFC